MNAAPIAAKRNGFPNLTLPLLACLASAMLLPISCTTTSSRPIREADYSEPIRVACVGDSITYGHGLKDRDRESYPAQLQKLLGARWKIMNYGFSGATLLKEGTKPYARLPVYRAARLFKPDVVIIELGTNDTNPKSWPPHQGEFVADYLDLIRSFRELETKPRIYLCMPPPLFRDRDKSYDTDRILAEEVIPKIRQVARKANVPVIELYTEFADKAGMFPDGVHPDARGARVMAAAIYGRLVGRHLEDHGQRVNQ